MPITLALSPAIEELIRQRTALEAERTVVDDQIIKLNTVYETLTRDIDTLNEALDALSRLVST